MGGNSNSQPQVKRTQGGMTAPGVYRSLQRQNILFAESWISSTTNKLQQINSANKANPVQKKEIIRQIKNLKIQQKLIENVRNCQLQEIKTNITQKGITITMDFLTNKHHEKSSIIAAGESPSKNVLDETQAGLEGETDKIFKMHCEALNLSIQQGNDEDKVRTRFFQLIWKFSQDKNQNPNDHKLVIQEKRQKREKVLLAFQYIIDKIYDTHYLPQEYEIIETIYKGNVKQLQKMIKEKPQILKFRTKGTNYPLLYLAARSGHTEIVEVLIKTGMKLNFEADKSTPLHVAAYCGHYHVVKLLLKYGIPHDIQNCDGDTPLQNANGYTREVLEQAEKDPFYVLAKMLISANLCKTVVNVQNSKGEIVIRKILLPCYDQNFDDYIDAFHGTLFEYLSSIAKYGLRTPGTKVEDRVISVNKGNIQQGVEIEGDENWARKIYVSNSIHYAAIYSELQYFMDEVMDRKTGWMPMVQVKVKKGSYKTFGDTTSMHERVDNEPQDLQYQIQNENDVKVVALMIVKRVWLGKFFGEKQKNYNKTKDMMLFNKQQKLVRFVSKIVQ